MYVESGLAMDERLNPILPGSARKIGVTIGVTESFCIQNTVYYHADTSIIRFPLALPAIFR